MIDEYLSCCFTGYRPHKFPFSFESDNSGFNKLSNSLITAVSELAENGCYTFYCGMAMGFDILAGETVLLIKKAYENKANIRLIAVIPFKEQAKAFPENWKKRYDALLEAADERVLMANDYSKGCFSCRNEFMVKMSDYVVTWFDGKSGGTKNTVAFAKGLGRSVINLYEER